MVRDYQKIILELMIKQEMILSELYNLFSVQFPEYNKMWKELSNEEKEHADWIKRLSEYESGEEVLFHEDNVRTHTMKAFIEYVEKLFYKAKMGGLIFKEAVSAARDLEMSLIEKKAFTHFDALSDRMKKVLNMLEAKTKEHYERMRKLVAKGM
jgi:hypothetical protein